MSEAPLPAEAPPGALAPPAPSVAEPLVPAEQGGAEAEPPQPELDAPAEPVAAELAQAEVALAAAAAGEAPGLEATSGAAGASAPAVAAPAAAAAPRAPAAGGGLLPREGYLVGPLFDCLHFIYMPLIALALGALLSQTAWARTAVWVDGRPMLVTNLFLGTMIASHLVLVVLRSHGNREVFRRFPWRFTLVPVALFVALYSSIWVAVCTTVVAVWWDLYHSSMQTFGLGRLYERKLGNDVEAGRRLDIALNLLLYAGPVLGGATLFNHLRYFDRFERVGAAFFTAIPARVGAVSSYLTWGLLGLGVPFLAYYVYAYWRLAQQGHRISPQKVALLVSTGVTSIYTWGFNSFGQAFFIMNFFHAWQYFAIVWWSEGGNWRRMLRLEGGGPLRWGAAFALFLALPVAYGALVTYYHLNTNNALFCTAMVVTIMHFWYDGFIWSVRKRHV